MEEGVNVELSAVQRFFLISGVASWYLVILAILAFVGYLIVKPIPEKRKTIDFVDFISGSSEEEVKRKTRELKKYMKGRDRNV